MNKEKIAQAEKEKAELEAQAQAVLFSYLI